RRLLLIGSLIGAVEAASRHRLVCPAPRRQLASCNARPSANSGSGFRPRSRLSPGADIPPPVRGSVLLDSMHPTRCTSSAKRPPPLLLPYEGAGMGPYQGEPAQMVRN